MRRVRVYELAPKEGAEWVVPVGSRSHEGIGSLDGRRIGNLWSPPLVSILTTTEDGRPRTVSHLPWLGADALVLDGFAAAVLRDPLRECAELLRLDCPHRELWLVNVTAISDALDLDQSDVERFPSSGRIMRVERYGLRADRVPDLPLFRLVGIRATLSTDSFVTMLRDRELEGPDFRLVWATGDESLP